MPIIILFLIEFQPSIEASMVLSYPTLKSPKSAEAGSLISDQQEKDGSSTDETSAIIVLPPLYSSGRPIPKVFSNDEILIDKA